MGTSYGAAIDYLITGINPVASQTLLTALLAVDLTVVLADTLPTANQQSLVVIGRPDFDQTNSIDGNSSYQVMGKQKIEEEYDLHGYIECYRDGPAVKTVRDAVLALYDAVVHFIWQDPTFNNTFADGRIGYVSVTSLSITGGTTTTPGDQRMGLLNFAIHIKNPYVP